MTTENVNSTFQHMHDAQLVQQYRQGDTAAFPALMNRWRTRIFAFCYRYFADSDDAEEITQRTFIKAYYKLDSLNEDDKFGAWLYRIAQNLCRDELGSSHRRRTVALPGSPIEEQAETASPSADGGILAKERSQVIHDALICLPTEQRVVVILKHFDGLTFAEIAAILDEPENTVKSRLYYGLKSLRKHLLKLNIDD